MTKINLVDIAITHQTGQIVILLSHNNLTLNPEKIEFNTNGTLFYDNNLVTSLPKNILKIVIKNQKIYIRDIKSKSNIEIKILET